MARTVIRSLRIDEDLKDNLDRLPDGTVNTLVNELLELFFEDDNIQKMVVLRDNRFDPDNWKPVAEVSAESADTEPQPTKPNLEPTISEPVKVPTVDEVMGAVGGGELVEEEVPIVGPMETIVDKPGETVDKPKSDKTLDDLFGF